MSDDFDESKLSVKDWLVDSNEKRSFEELPVSEKYDSLKRKQRHYEQMRWEIARIVDSNWDKATKFVTLTFRENITSIDIANRKFQNFIKRLKRRKHNNDNQLKYIATWEKQKRGAIHYHVVFFSFGYLKKSELEEIWGNGFVQINRVDVDSRENRGRYLSKYFAKDLELKEHKKKAFFKSQNLKMPRVRKISTSQPLDLSNKDILYSKNYSRKILDFTDFTSEFPTFKHGTVHYTKIKK